MLQLVKVKKERGICMSKSITPWGRQCKAQMILKNLTLEELSISAGLSKTYVSAIINGRIVVPDETVQKINKVLGIQPQGPGCQMEQLQ